MALKRNHIAAVFSVEFIVLGLLAGFVGVIFANLLSRVLLHRLDVAFHIEWLATAIALVRTAVLATATGWAGSHLDTMPTSCCWIQLTGATSRTTWAVRTCMRSSSGECSCE